MNNIYELFESMKEYQLDLQYNRIVESFEVYESVYFIKENIEIVNEADEGNKSTLADRATNIFEFLRQQLEKIVDWITNIIKKFNEDFSVGKKFLELNDVNKAMQKIVNSNNTTMVKCHSQHRPIVNVQSEFKSNINKLQNEGKRYTMNNAANKTSVEDIVKRYYKVNTIEEIQEAINQKFGMGENQVKEVRLSTIDIMQLQNTLNNAENVNKTLEESKRNIQDFYDKHMNKIKRTGNSSNENKINKSSGELKYFNDFMRVINETIRVYLKIVRNMFNEDFAIAKKIVAIGNGKKNKEEK